MMTFMALKLPRIVTLAWLGLACWSASRAADDAGSAVFSLGRIAQFSLQDAQGMTRTRKSWQAAPAVVRLFSGIECPVANSYAPEMTRRAQQFADPGVLFVGVHGDPDVAQRAAEALRKADKNGDGKLSLDEIIAASGNRETAADLEKKVAQFDRDGDKPLNLSEVIEALKSLGK